MLRKHKFIFSQFWRLEVQVKVAMILVPGEGFPDRASGKEPACQSRRHKRCRLDPWVGRAPGGGHGNPFQYSGLENSMDRETWQATVHGAAKKTDMTEAT